jgi:hypothetical protein
VTLLYGVSCFTVFAVDFVGLFSSVASLLILVIVVKLGPAAAVSGPIAHLLSGPSSEKVTYGAVAGTA